MREVYILLLLILFCISSVREHNVYNPISLFSAIWAFVFFLAHLRLYDLNEASITAYSFAFIGVMFFSLGCLFKKKTRIDYVKIKQIDLTSDVFLNYSFLIVFYTIILLFTMVLATASIRLIRSGVSMALLRNTYDDVSSGMVIKSNLVYQFENYIVTTAEFAAIALLPIVITDNVKRSKKLFLFIEMLAFLILHMFVTGARSFLIDIAIIFVLYMLVNKDMIKQFREYFQRIPKFVFIIIGIGAIGLVVFMTTLRKGSDEPIFRQIYRYFSISMPLFDTHLNMQKNSPEYTYGWTILYGVVRPWFSFLHNFGFPFPNGLEKAIEQVGLNNSFYPVGGGWANSFVTVFYYECMDFGKIGIVIFSFLYGIVSEKCYMRMKAYPNQRNQAMYLLIAIGLFLSFARLFFTAFRYVYAFVILYIAFRKRKEDSLL